MPNTPEPLISTRFLSSADVMRITGHSNKSSFFQFVRSNGIPFIRIGVRKVLFEEAALRAWLNSRTVGAVPEAVR